MKRSSSTFKKRTNVGEMAHLINEIIDIAKKNNIHCWLNYGALLGMIREDRLLPWNNDAELSCWYSNSFKINVFKLVDDLSLAGYNVYYYTTNGTINIKKNKNDININCYWLENNLAVRAHEECSKFKKKLFISYILYWFAMSMSIYTSKIKFVNFKNANIKEKIKIVLICINKILPYTFRKLIYKKLIYLSKNLGSSFIKTGFPSYFFDDFININFYGSEVSIPQRNKDLLQYIYGDDWETPMDNWSFYSDENQQKTNIQFINESWDYDNVDFV